MSAPGAPRDPACDPAADPAADPVTGIAAGYLDVFGAWHPTSDEARRRIATAMGHVPGGPPLWFVPVGESHHLWSACRVRTDDGRMIGPFDELPGDLPIGYHDLIPVDGGPTTRLIVHPHRCPAPPRVWGAAAQLYSVWDEHAWGIGDLGTLRRFAERLVAAGGGAVLVSPLHQGPPTFPQQDSPYSPSTRRAWSPLLLAIDEPPPPALRMAADRWIDRDAVWRAKRAWLWGRFAAHDGRGIADDQVGAQDDDVVESSAIAMWNARAECGEGADEETVRRTARFHDWIQRRIAEQLADVRATGALLIGDLAVGFSPDGADADEFASVLADGVEVGAPPDEFNPAGQTWGLPPFVPAALRAAAYTPFIDTVRAAFRGVDGLRIDHVMGLFRQYWVPHDTGAAGGAYVQYAVDELLAIVAIEATRANAFVIGEDLGTVPAEVHEAMHRWGVAGTKVAMFEDAPPAAWPVDCLATVTTHDLPTIRQILAHDPDEPRRRRLLAAAGVSDVDEPFDDAADDMADDMADDVADNVIVSAIHRALLASPAAVRLVSTDDLAGATEQPNVPGTVGPPNWCRPLPCPVESIPFPDGISA